MAERELISIIMDNTSNTAIRNVTQYNIILTERGLKLKTIISKRAHHRNGNRSTVVLKIYKNTNNNERVKVKSGKHTKIIVNNSKIKKIKRREEKTITKAMQQLSI